MGFPNFIDLVPLKGFVDSILNELNLSGNYATYLTLAAVLFLLGLFAPLIGALLRLILSILGETIRVPLRWTRGITNELAIAIYRHGPLFSRNIARPLAIALLIGAGYAAFSASTARNSRLATSQPGTSAAAKCSGEIVDLSCPRPR